MKKQILAALALVPFLAVGCGNSTPRQASTARLTATPAVTATHAPLGTSVSFGFDAEPAGPVTALFSVLSGDWVIRTEAGAPSPPQALCATGRGHGPALLIAPSAPLAQLTDSVSLKFLGPGSAGLVFHEQDALNYYLVRADAVPGRIVIALVRNGRTTTLASAPAPLAVNSWQELSAQVRGTTITAFLNGVGIVQARDASLGQGSIGLWSSSQTEVCFDNLMATEI